jgi:hypothetical protein
MDTPIGHQELRTAIRDINVERAPSFADPNAQWDQAISVLVTAREQHGGEIRRLITALLTTASESQRKQVAAELESRLRTIARQTRTGRWRPFRSTAQLTLFNPDDASTLVR